MDKIVRFDKFCKYCEHKKVLDIEGKDPCNECLSEGGRADSKKPLKFQGELPPYKEIYND